MEPAGEETMYRDTINDLDTSLLPAAVLLPVYGGDEPELVSESIKSLIQQDIGTEQFRIYVGVDGPIPEALERNLKSFSNQIYRIVRSDRNRGLAQTLNMLIGTLENERLVFRMDADDFALPQRFRLQVAFMSAHPDVGVLGGAILEKHLETGKERVRTYPQTDREIRKAIAYRNPVAHPTTCIRTQVLRAVGAYPLTKNQDLALWFACMKQDIRFANLPAILVQMNVSGKFFARRGIGRGLSEFRIYVDGILKVHGVSWRLVFPFVRLAFRLMPKSVIERVYFSRMRA